MQICNVHNYNLNQHTQKETREIENDKFACLSTQFLCLQIIFISENLNVRTAYKLFIIGITHEA